MKKTWLALLASIAFTASAVAQDIPPAPLATPECPQPPTFDPVSFGVPLLVTVETEEGAFVFTTDIARTPRQRSRGMMYRPEVADDEAMLFIFDDDAPRSFFMRNTCAPLDMVWVTKDLIVAGVSENAVPFSEEQVLSQEPVRFVFEIAGGRAAEIGLTRGDRLRLPGG